MSYLGASGGVSSPGFPGAQVSPAFGLQMGRRLTPDAGVAAYFQISNHKDALDVSEVKQNFYGIEGNYYFTGDMDGLVIGVKFGLATLDPSVGRSSTAVSVGPKLAFDHRVNSRFSFGFEGNLLSQGKKDTVGGYTTVNLLGLVKLWF